MEWLVTFLNGNIFGYLLHAAEILLALALFGIGLKKRSWFKLRVACTIVVFVVLSVLLGAVLEEAFPYGRYLISFLLSLLMFPLCFKIGIWDSSFRCLAAATTQNISYCTAGLIAGLCGWDPIRVAWPAAAVQAAVYLVVQVGLYILCRFDMKNMDVDFAQERYPLIIIAVILSLINYVIQLGRQSLEAPEFFAWQIMFISFDILLLCMLFGLSERNRLRRENAILDQIRAGEERQYELDQSAIETINIKCHDLKHQLIALRNLRGPEQEQAFKDVEKAVMIYDSIVQTGCKPLDVILKSKYLICEREKIRFTYMVDGEKLAFMSAVDIYSLFGNALDNAIRAAREVPDETKRLINCSVTAHGQLLLIHIENSMRNRPNLVGGLPVTTKSDTANHGFGMISMRRTAESYGGVMSVSCQEHLFCLDMTIPIRARGEDH